jgi:hypothetical protein
VSRKHRNALHEQPESPPPTSQRLAEMAGPAVVGWVVRYDGTGYRRCRVRIPLEFLDEVRVGEETGPDHRSTQAAWIQRELMTDDVLHEIHREHKS